MTAIEGFDTSYAKPSGKDAAAAGLKAAMLYITPSGPGNKGITQAVWDDYTAHGIKIGLVWEQGTDAVLKGYGQGVADARAAVGCLAALKGPAKDLPIYFAIDFDIQPADYPKALAYFTGVNSVIGSARTGGYGHYDILTFLTAHRVIDKRWQTSAWSYGKLLTQIDVLQYQNEVSIGSGTVDRDRMYSRNWGQLGVSVTPAPAPAPKPKPAPKPIVYTVKDGDSLSSIAAHFKTTWQKIYAANKKIIGSDPNKIKAGEKLTIPQA